MKNNPLISVIIPVYNAEQYLAQAIQSVLTQTLRPDEIIVIDDGSTDDSGVIARGFGPQVRYERQQQSGAGAARNRGVALAQGQFLAFLDADDLWCEDKLEKQMAMLDKDPELEMIFGHVQQFHSPELTEADRETKPLLSESIPGYVPGTMLVQRDAFWQVGEFETGWQVGEFIDWYLKAVEQGLNSTLLPDVVMRRRVHQTNLGIRKKAFQTDYVRIIKASLDRRRQQQKIVEEKS